MMDIAFIRANADAFRQAIADKHIACDLDALLALDLERRALIGEVNTLRGQRNALSDHIAGATADARPGLVAESKVLKETLLEREAALAALQQRYDALMVTVPTIPAADAPRGIDDSENREVGRWGEIPSFSFVPQDHSAIAERLHLIDFARGTAVSGYRGYYLTNEGASLVMALMAYAMHKLIGAGFTPMIPPTIVKEDVLFGSGYFKGLHYDGSVDEVYHVATNDKEADGSMSHEKKFLVGTAEPSLLAYYAKQTLDGVRLPLKIAGFSPCYRSEIGSYGKDTKGLYRVHEFFKVEQVVIAPADVHIADVLHDEMVALSRAMHAELGLPHRQLAICTGDMGLGKYRQFDLETWMPGLDRWGETGSASNLLDWQARRLQIAYTDAEGNKHYAYTLNNTALPSPRILIGILENYQQADGSVVVPEVLRPFMPGNIARIG